MIQVQIGMDEVLAMSREEHRERHQMFLDKFKPKLTTDDCYTPGPIYEAIAGWVAEEYNADPERFVRPFWPGADYRTQEYPEGCVVVDNPPFSILAEIVNFFTRGGVDFFLFAPALTLFSARHADVSYLAAGCTIVYENGAEVKTSFITNLDSSRVRTTPELWRRVEEAKKLVVKKKESAPKYEFPAEVVTAAMVQRWTRYGVDWRLPKDECIRISTLDSMREKKKDIFGGAYLMTERMAASRVEAEKQANHAAAREQAEVFRWELSERERRIIDGLSDK